jgi:hypothetical protein
VGAKKLGQYAAGRDHRIAHVKKGAFSPAGGAGLNRCQAYCKGLPSEEKIIFFN